MEIRFVHSDTENFIRSLEQASVAKVLRVLDLLERFGYRLGMPHSKPIASGIFELRIRGVQEVRLLYVLHGGTIFILHGFRKKSNKIPLKEFATARHRMRTLTQNNTYVMFGGI